MSHQSLGSHLSFPTDSITLLGTKPESFETPYQLGHPKTGLMGDEKHPTLGPLVRLVVNPPGGR